MTSYMPLTRQGQANLRRADSRDPEFRYEISFVMTNMSPWLMKYSPNPIITFGGWQRLVTSLQDIKAKPILGADTVHLEFRSEISDRASVCHLLALCSHTHTHTRRTKETGAWEKAREKHFRHRQSGFLHWNWNLSLIIPWNHWERLHNSFHMKLSFFSNSRPCFVLGLLMLGPCTLLLASMIPVSF